MPPRLAHAIYVGPIASTFPRFVQCLHGYRTYQIPSYSFPCDYPDKYRVAFLSIVGIRQESTLGVPVVFT